jgi:hypothetical protein
MAAGDLCKVSRKFYYHWFIEGPDNTAVHYTGTPVNKTNASVKLTSIEDVLQGGEKEIVRAADSAKSHLIVERAMQHVGMSSYHLAFNNCEHFAKHCAVGIHTSAQVNRAVIVSLACMTAGASGGVIGLVLGAVQGPIVEATSTYFERHTRKLFDRPEFLFLSLLIAVLTLLWLNEQRKSALASMNTVH